MNVAGYSLLVTGRWFVGCQQVVTSGCLRPHTRSVIVRTSPASLVPFVNDRMLSNIVRSIISSRSMFGLPAPRSVLQSGHATRHAGSEASPGVKYSLGVRPSRYGVNVGE